MSQFHISPEKGDMIDAIRYFCAPGDLPQLIRQYGTEQGLAEANLAAFSENREGTFILLRSGMEVARAKYGTVTKWVEEPSRCPRCKGTGGGEYNDCPGCDGNGVV